MDNTRRVFLGQVLGILASNGLPFLAEEALYTGKVDTPDIVINPFQIMMFRIFAVTVGGVRVWAPRMEKAKLNNKLRFCSFQAERIKPTVSLSLIGAGLVDPQGRLVQEQTFERPFYLIPMDSLVITYNLRNSHGR